MYDEDECPRCGGYHHEDEHDETPEEAGIPWHHFGPLYHGTQEDVEGHFDPAHTSGSTYNTQRMAGNYGRGVYATTGFHEAKIYAGEHGTVHEVEPHPEDHGDFDYQVDPMGGSQISHFNGMTIRDAHEIASYGDQGGDGVSLIFPGRMLSKRQFRVSRGEQP